MTTLFISGSDRPDAWIAAWTAAAPQRPIAVHGRDHYDPSAIRYALSWQPPAGALAKLPRLEAIFNLGAGVDGVLADPTLPDMPLVRLVDDDLTLRMGEWVVLQVLLHHRQALAYLAQQGERTWRELRQPAAGAVRVGLMGYGTLARHAAPILLALGFNVIGWSRSKKPSDVTLYVGREGMDPFLERTHILVALLPLTADTRGILDRTLIGKLDRDGPIGPILINAGRGGSQNEADLLEALRSGALAGASLDVFATEPLPADDPLWQAPNLVITPHAAAISDPDATVRGILKQIEAHERGEPLQNVVDRTLGY